MVNNPFSLHRLIGLLGCIKHSITSQSKQANILLDLALVQPHLDYSVPFWSPQFKKEAIASD